MNDSSEFSFSADFASDPFADALYDETRGHGFVTGENTARLASLQTPELNSGFVPAWWYAGNRLASVEHGSLGCRAVPTDEIRAEDFARSRRVPLIYRADVPAAGQYRVTLALCAEEDEPEVLVYQSRRRLAWRGSLRRGERREITFRTDVSPIVPRGKTEREECTGVTVAVVSSSVYLNRFSAEQSSCRVLYIMGDSTVTDQSADVPYSPGASYSGWGQMISAFLPEDICVSNHAHSGLTTESFRSEGHWDIMSSLVRPGDICLMQFAHNDQKLPHLKAYGGYTKRMKQYIGELRGLGVLPVIVTPLSRNTWKPDGDYNDLLSEYAEACFALGRETGTMIVDLHGESKKLLLKNGLEKSKQWYFPGDYTHTNDWGAYRAAGCIAAALRSLRVIPFLQQTKRWPCGSPVQPLVPPAEAKAPAEVETAPLFSDLERPDDTLTRVDALGMVIRTLHFFPINVYNDLFSDVLGSEPYAGTVQCAAQNGLIPAFLTSDGALYPQREITLGEFLAVLTAGYASRHSLSGSSATLNEAEKRAVSLGLVPEDASFGKPVTRGRAAELCRAASR